MSKEWGPLAGLIGEWQGQGGLDTSFSHSRGEVWKTPYLEKVTMKPFGPVENGSQSLYGLDYKTAMWRDDETNPFHTEVGYWLWDAATGEVLRGFVVPRGIVVLAGGKTTADSKEFTMSAELGSSSYAIGENTYLGQHASTRAFTVTVTVNGPDSWGYIENSSLKMDQFPDIFPHTDGNTLTRVA